MGLCTLSWPPVVTVTDIAAQPLRPFLSLLFRAGTHEGGQKIQRQLS